MDASKDKPKKNIHAVELGKLGGKRRFELMSVEEKTELGTKGGTVGGKARAAALTKTRRSEIARNAAEARWQKEKQKQTPDQ